MREASQKVLLARQEYGRRDHRRLARGYGYIIPDDGSSDVFVHISAAETLEAGQRVEFEIGRNSHDGRPKAVRVRRCDY